MVSVCCCVRVAVFALLSTSCCLQGFCLHVAICCYYELLVVCCCLSVAICCCYELLLVVSVLLPMYCRTCVAAFALSFWCNGCYVLLCVAVSTCQLYVVSMLLCLLANYMLLSLCCCVYLPTICCIYVAVSTCQLCVAVSMLLCLLANYMLLSLLAFCCCLLMCLLVD